MGRIGSRGASPSPNHYGHSTTLTNATIAVEPIIVDPPGERNRHRVTMLSGNDLGPEGQPFAL
jgi:hypothetical protein